MFGDRIDKRGFRSRFITAAPHPVCPLAAPRTAAMLINHVSFAFPTRGQRFFPNKIHVWATCPVLPRSLSPFSLFFLLFLTCTFKTCRAAGRPVRGKPEGQPSELKPDGADKIQFRRGSGSPRARLPPPRTGQPELPQCHRRGSRKWQLLSVTVLEMPRGLRCGSGLRSALTPHTSPGLGKRVFFHRDALSRLVRGRSHSGLPKRGRAVHFLLASAPPRPPGEPPGAPVMVAVGPGGGVVLAPKRCLAQVATRVASGRVPVAPAVKTELGGQSRSGRPIWDTRRSEEGGDGHAGDSGLSVSRSPRWGGSI